MDRRVGLEGKLTHVRETVKLSAEHLVREGLGAEETEPLLVFKQTAAGCVLGVLLIQPVVSSSGGI